MRSNSLSACRCVSIIASATSRCPTRPRATPPWLLTAMIRPPPAFQRRIISTASGNTSTSAGPFTNRPSSVLPFRTVLSRSRHNSGTRRSACTWMAPTSVSFHVSVFTEPAGSEVTTAQRFGCLAFHVFLGHERSRRAPGRDPEVTAPCPAHRPAQRRPGLRTVGFHVGEDLLSNRLSHGRGSGFEDLAGRIGEVPPCQVIGAVLGLVLAEQRLSSSLQGGFRDFRHAVSSLRG